MELKEFLERYKFLIIILATIFVVFASQQSHLSSNLSQFGTPENLNQVILTCKFEECIPKLQNMGYSMEDIKGFVISCNRYICEVRK